MADDGGDRRKAAAGSSSKQAGKKQKGRNRGTPIPLEFLGFSSTSSSRSSREFPHGFRSREDWLNQTRPLAHAVREVTGTQDEDNPPPIFIAGSAVTGESYASKRGGRGQPDRPAGTPFGPHSDFDMAIASPEIYDTVTADKNLKSYDSGADKTLALHARQLHEAGHEALADGVGALERSSRRSTSVAIFDIDSAEHANSGRPYIERPHTPRLQRRDRSASSSGAGAGAGAPPASGWGAGDPGPSQRGPGRGGFLRQPEPPGGRSAEAGASGSGSSGGAPPPSSAALHSPRAAAHKAAAPPARRIGPDSAAKRENTDGAAKAPAKGPNKGRKR